MLHLRVTVPSELAAAIHDRLARTPGVAHLAWLPGTSTLPPGDLLLERAERSHGVELHRRGVGLRFGRDAPESGGLDDDVQCL